jgi:hypothetical protein
LGFESLIRLDIPSCDEYTGQPCAISEKRMQM